MDNGFHEWMQKAVDSGIDGEDPFELSQAAWDHKEKRVRELVPGRLKEVRKMLAARDYYSKMTHPERNSSLGHSGEIHNIHIEDVLKQIEADFGLPVTNGYDHVLSDRNADFSIKDKDHE